MDKAAPDPLKAIRDRIDMIDAEMHRLLIERSGVIAELIEIKGTSKPGAAFRPDREADMMHRLVMRHEGRLPLLTAEHIWREIITTFTAMQAPFGIAAGPSPDALAMRDLIRFYFGFSVPIAEISTNAAAIARVAGSGKDIAVIAADSSERWWGALANARAPKIFARLPFIELADRPAHVPAYVIGPPLKEQAEPDIRVLAVTDSPQLAAAVESFGGMVMQRHEGEALVELPVAATSEDLADASGIAVRTIINLGGIAQPIRLLAERPK